ncbi:MAG TPA: VOC family protein [Chloroflexota bacterium]|nr:VOC family protein [Chloroflexota bacterium]
MPVRGRFAARRILVYVEDLEAATAFYRDVLGFTEIQRLEGSNVELDTGGPPLVLHAGGAKGSEPPAMRGVVPSFRVRDLPAVAEELERRGVKTVSPLQEVPHGHIYFFADLEGNIIQLYQAKED